MSTPYSIPYVKKKGSASFEDSIVKFYTTLAFMEDVTIHPPQTSVANMRVFPSGIGSKIPRANEALSKVTLTRILLGRVRDAGSGAKVQLKSRPYYHAYLLQKGFRRIWLPAQTQMMPVGT